jgi:hypothetical protein
VKSNNLMEHRYEVAMRLGSDCGIWPDDFRAAHMALHIRSAAIRCHLFAAIHLSLGHPFAWKEAGDLWDQDPEDGER